MKSFNTAITSVMGGVAGGVLVMLLVVNSPQAAKFFQLNRPLASETPPSADKIENGTASESLTGGEEAVVKAVEKANPAVVSIVITKDIPIVERYYKEVPNSQRDPFGDFFGGDLFSPFNLRVPQYRQKGTEKKEIGGGSGFLISADGMIITNKHVVSENDVDYTVLMNNGKKYDAQVVARDPVNDLAVIQIKDKELPYLEFADSDQLKVGQTVIAIGNALAEFRNTVSVGVISGLSRSITAGNGFGESEQLDEVIQTDAAINPGNSGGPLLNINGDVVGINVAVALGSQSIGFALPVNFVKSVVQSVKETGKIVRPYLGVRYIPITPTVQEKNKLSVDYGMLITRGQSMDELAVIPGSPADKAGLSEGDIILEIDGKRLDIDHTLASYIRKKSVGDSVSLKILSKGGEKTIAVKLEAMPD